MLTVRDSREGKRTIIPRSRVAVCTCGRWQAFPSDRFIHLNGGFQPGKIYEYVYVVADPVVAGGGFAAIRDFASYAKHDPMPLLRRNGSTVKASRRTGAFCATFSTRASMRMKKERSRWTGFWPM